MQYLFEAESVSKRYAHHLALDKVSISVPQGSIFGLLGPNGAGKTTMIRIINQILAPDEGKVFLEGHEMKPDDIYSIGYLPEERGLYKKMKVGEQALYLAQLKGLSHQEAMKRLKYWFDRFEIHGWWDRKVEELSKGMQQKVQFLITIIHEPKLLIFDEPFSGFDPINVNLLKDEILAQKEKGATIIFSTHNMASVEELCDHIALINKSKKILEGKVREIKKAFKTNLYEMEVTDHDTDIRAHLKEGYQLMEEERHDDTRFIKVHIPANGSGSELLQMIIPHMTILNFREVIPTMNDIFIQTVANSN
ncbi:MAG: ABC transporter ATP-binding protein [Bacteroidetes bacterium]|nr:ABC transporter ATP-binding protein [Bacteroidota bacterium]